MGASVNLEQRLGAIIGELVIKNAAMANDLEAAQDRIKELENPKEKARKKRE